MLVEAAAAALRLGLEAEIFEGADAVEWAMERLNSDSDVSADLIELATAGDESRAFCLEVLRRVNAAPSAATTQQLLAGVFLLRQRGVAVREVARRFKAIANRLGGQH